VHLICNVLKFQNQVLSVITYQNLLFSWILQDGEVWTFSVRSSDTSLPDRIIHVNYDGFAEGYPSMLIFFLESTFF
jgi:hypothetical protein